MLNFLLVALICLALGFLCLVIIGALIDIIEQVEKNRDN
jgi:hypothetical protein